MEIDNKINNGVIEIDPKYDEKLFKALTENELPRNGSNGIIKIDPKYDEKLLKEINKIKPDLPYCGEISSPAECFDFRPSRTSEPAKPTQNNGRGH